MAKSTLLCLALLVAHASAQDPSQELDELLIERVKQKLASEVAGDVAWGGYLAQRYRLKSADRALLEALGKWRDRDGIEARVVRLHLVDGLVGVRAQVAVEQVEFLLEDPLTRDAAFGLLVGKPIPNREAILRAAMAPAEEEDSVRQVAAEVIVACGLRSPEYAQFLLRHLKSELKVTVIDARSGVGGVEWSTSWWISTDYLRRGLERRPGFPPIVRLGFGSQSGESDSIPVTWPPGRSPFVISRSEHVTYEVNKLRRGAAVESPPAILVESTLARMAGRGLAARQNLEHDFVDAATFTQAVLAARAAQVSDLDAFVISLREQCWLRPDDLPGYRIPLEVKVYDDRGDKTVPLPELPPFPPPAPAGDGR